MNVLKVLVRTKKTITIICFHSRSALWVSSEQLSYDGMPPENHTKFKHNKMHKIAQTLLNMP